MREAEHVSSDGIGELGEFGLIDAVTRRLPRGDAVILGPGDDAAIVRARDGRVVASTDLLVENHHFRRDWAPAYDIGRRAAAANLADIVAMGAVPTALLVGLAAPAALAVDWALELVDGLRDECLVVGASIAGGDVSRADAVVLGITALGDLEGNPAVTRAGARPGDTVVLAGRVGWAAAGLAVLHRGFRSPRVLVEAYRRPDPPYALGPLLAAAGATSMCDVSDGLVQDLGHIAAASEVGIDIDRASLQLTDALRDVGNALNTDPYEWLLNGGDDHALVATLPPDVEPPESCIVIGSVTDGAGVLLDGRPYEGAGGHDHFA
jgi:thiamine-monophosphate kinase